MGGLTSEWAGELMANLCSVDQLVDEVDCVLASVRLAHHLGDTVGADAIICVMGNRARERKERRQAHTSCLGRE